MHTLKPASLQSVGTVGDAMEKTIADLAGRRGWRIGYEAGASSKPASYAAMHLYGERMTPLIGNVEPAAYFKGYDGVRHCDVVSVTEPWHGVLTPFQCNKEPALKGPV